jgi:GTP cyclohydrolase I
MQELPTKKAAAAATAAVAAPASTVTTLPSEQTQRVEQIAGHFLQIMYLLGLDVDEHSLSETPMRVAKMLLSFNQSFDPESLLKVFTTDQEASGIVAQTGIPFAMLCEHHFLPAVGTVNIAYLPHNGKVVGLSKLSRLVRAVGQERPTLQEAIGQRIANLITEHLEAKGVMVSIRAEHTCMTCRGAQAPGVKTVTSVVKGLFRDVPAARQEAFAIWNMKG